MAKTYDYHTFTLQTIDGKEISITCWTYEHSSGWGHKASVNYVGDAYYCFEKRQTYYNRTWESFKYETVLQKIIAAFFDGKRNKNNRAFIQKQIDAIAHHESEKCAAWLASFKAAFNGLTDEQRSRIAESEIMIENEKQADACMSVIAMMAALNGSK